MKKFLSFSTGVLTLLVLHINLTSGGDDGAKGGDDGMDIIEVLESWADTKSDASTFLSVSGTTHAFVARMYALQSPDIDEFDGWAVISSASAEVFAESMGDNTEYNAIAWCAATGDSNTSPIPSRDNINTKRIRRDSDGRTYYGDDYVKGDAQIVYKSHPVATSKRYFWSKPENRTLRDSIYRRYADTDDSSPSGLTAAPDMWASLETTSRQFLNIGLGTVSISDPAVKRDSTESPFVSPGNRRPKPVSTITGDCGIHTISPSQASEHNWGRAPCGDDAHVDYLCQINTSEHAWSTPSCRNKEHADYQCKLPLKMSIHSWEYGNCASQHYHPMCERPRHKHLEKCPDTPCTGTDFYACDAHTHSYQSPSSSSSSSSSSRYVDRITCLGGHTYSRGQRRFYVEWHKTLTCTRCGNSYSRCSNSLGDCKGKYSHRWR